MTRAGGASWPDECCPACLETDSIDLAGAGRLCLQCRHEWDPATTAGPLPRDTAAVANAEIVRDVTALTADIDTDIATQLATARAMFVGRDVVYFAEGVVGRVAEVFDSGYSRVEFGSGFEIDLLPDEFALVETSVVPDEVVRALGAADLTAAAMIVNAAVETFAVTAGRRHLGIPPHGYLPADPEAWIVVEHGAAYAVAAVAMLTGFSNEDLTILAERMGDAARAAEGGHKT